MKNRTIPTLNLVTLLFTIAVNALANIVPFNGITTGALSDLYPVLFTPAGYVFSIWGLIYLALFAFAIFQILPSQSENPLLGRIGGWFILANLLNAAWIFSWHYRLVPLSLLIMLVLLVSLIVIYTRLEIGKKLDNGIIGTFIHFPFSLYLGWISVATIANFSVFLYTLNWDGFGLSPVFWTICMLAVGIILGGLMIHNRKEIIFPLVIIWAYAGIQFKPDVNPAVGSAAGLSALLLLFYLLFSLLRARQAEMISKRPNLL